jgi:hypothetical protein
MLDVPGLKDLATKKLQEHLDTHWREGFVDIVKEVYSTTSSSGNKGFREVIVQSAYQHLDDHLKEDEFDKLLGEVGEFSRSLVKLLKTTQGSAGPTHMCIFCKVACGWRCHKCGCSY